MPAKPLANAQAGKFRISYLTPSEVLAKGLGGS